RGDELVDIRRLAGIAAAAALGPATALARRVLRGLLGEDVLELGVVAARDRIGGLDAVGVIDGVLVGAELGCRLRQLRRLGILAAILALEQRVAEELRLDEGIELEVTELQQPDRLHQLWRQREVLALPDL